MRLTGKIKASELMTSPVIWVHMREPIPIVARMFLENKVGCAVVVDGSGGEVGVITKTDLTRHDRERVGLLNALADRKILTTRGTHETFGISAGYHLDPEDQTIETWFTPQIFTVFEHDDLARVLRQFLEKGIHHVFVRGGKFGRIVGVITTMDLVRHSLDWLGKGEPVKIRRGVRIPAR